MERTRHLSPCFLRSTTRRTMTHRDMHRYAYGTCRVHDTHASAWSFPSSHHPPTTSRRAAPRLGRAVVPDRWSDRRAPRFVRDELTRLICSVRSIIHRDPSTEAQAKSYRVLRCETCKDQGTRETWSSYSARRFPRPRCGIRVLIRGHLMPENRSGWLPALSLICPSLLREEREANCRRCRVIRLPGLVSTKNIHLSSYLSARRRIEDML